MSEKTREGLFAESDYITLHMPLTPDTKGMINKDSIATMKTSTATFNTIIETGVYGSCVNLTVGEFAADMGYRKNIYSHKWITIYS